MSPLVINGFRLSSFIYPILWIGIPIFIYSLLARKNSILVSILLAIPLIPYFLFTLFYILQFIFCGYSERKYEYVNKKNENLKIVGRDFSCYGTSEDLVLYKEFSISKNIKIEMYYKKFVNYKNIDVDTTIWKHIAKF